MATVTTALKWTDVKNELFAYLGQSPDATAEALLKLLFDAAVAAADNYLENPFVDSDGLDVAQPPTVKLGVYEYVRVLSSFLKGKAHLKSVKTLQLAETFRDDKAPDAAQRAARGFWVESKLDLTTDGKW